MFLFGDTVNNLFASDTFNQRVIASREENWRAAFLCYGISVFKI